jgi:hypothetical protein
MKQNSCQNTGVNDGRNLTFYLEKTQKFIIFKQLKINKNGSKKSSKRN